ncbi:ABC transporter ATP-binding protein [Virgibacillus phasianinus]|uniref:ABC transporter ATP-binding protein n=1 Tax=Virgibacillus phasianinus TaxID=2017483 RepID=A0A220U4U9_9BACI|nr:ABC transporter permease [Virgibacillus phasianinus]ASK63012.1 ABC transporter ATP-binding protein [Virgibacillus phasianinus]
MGFIHHVILFTKNNVKQLLRKWPSLPLLFLFPIILVSLSAYIAISFFIPDEGEAIQVGLVDHDQSKETKLIVDLIEESSQLNNFIQLNVMSGEKAKQKLQNDHLSAYIIFPDDFVENLYNGTSVTLKIIGNPDKKMESYLVKELVDSVSRHIKTAQANILTINYYAKQLTMDDETRNDFLFNQFTDFVFYTLGKDKIVDEEIIANSVTNSPVHYYCLGGIFIILTIWILEIYTVLSRDDGARIKARMRLYNVKESDQILAKIFVSWLVTISFTVIVFIGFITVFSIDLFPSDYFKVAVLTMLYSFLFLLGLALIEVICTAPKMRLFIQMVYTAVSLLISGAIIPTIYFPYYVQNLLPYNFAYQAFYWMQEIVLNQRVFVDFLPLILYVFIGIFVLFGISTWKERVSN